MTDKKNSIPKQIGRYEVRGQLGTGGMGHVYRVYDPINQRELALKSAASTVSPDYVNFAGCDQVACWHSLPWKATPSVDLIMP